ncbi:MAG: hypothetical protein H8D67_08650 [Deltaproteobacteria bacterium]|nr:hypothetical protein [Deltaproteobacteria bacterium]
MLHDYSGFVRNALLVFVLLLIQSALFFPLSSAHAKREHLVYFPNTAYELNVYKIFGKRPGKTLMLIGGIQGNEPGGFLSADLYADMSLENGNLIVIPRTNFYSILLNQRGPHGDMNRKFTHEDITDSMEDKIVSILKKLIGESDYLLNLHDGSGYYYPKYINKWRNPMLFGQSIISDCEEYIIPGTEKRIELGRMARKVIQEVNPHIKNKLYKFHFNNTRTDNTNSPHKEQRRSATYYALTRHNIPAFGVETSKFLPAIDLKIRHHNLVINAFMKFFGIIPEYPASTLDPPILKYLVVSINGQIPFVVKNNQDIRLKAGDTIHVSHIEANYERGLSLDILGYGDISDLRKDFIITKDTNLIVRKDNQEIAEIPIRISQRSRESGEKDRTEKVKYLVIEAKGHRILLSNGEILDLVEGDHLKLLDVIPSRPDSSEVKVNFKGFVSNWKNNTGEDRGYDINTSSDLMARFSLQKKGKIYEIIVTDGTNVLGKFFVKLNPPRLDYLVLKVNDCPPKVLRSGDSIKLSKGDELCLEEMQTNLYSKQRVHLSINGHSLMPGKKQSVAMLIGDSAASSRNEAFVKKDNLLLGKINIYLE